MSTYWKNWIKAAAIRAVKTVAQTAVATIGTSAVLGDVNWLAVGSAAVLAGVLSLLTSLAGLPESVHRGDLVAQAQVRIGHVVACYLPERIAPVTHSAVVFDGAFVILDVVEHARCIEIVLAVHVLL